MGNHLQLVILKLPNIIYALSYKSNRNDQNLRSYVVLINQSIDSRREMLNYLVLYTNACPQVQ